MTTANIMDLKNFERLLKTCLVFVVLFLGTLAFEEYHDQDCMLDHEGSNQILENCLEKGERFVKEYMKVLRRGTQHNFGTCQNFYPFGECLRDLWKRCPTVRQVTHKHWKPIVDLLTTACNTTWERFEWHHDVQCLELEMSDVLVHRCDELYDFNIKQKTRDKCFFLKEAIHCKTALVNTSCGTEVGQVAYSLAKINAKKLIQKSRCYITMQEPYNGFRYTDNFCPRDFKDDMQECYDKHIAPTELLFSKDNDLIAQGTRKDLRDACGGWREYRNCIRPIKEDCKEGVDAVLEQNGLLRKYLLKTEYLCKEEKELYMGSLPCLQKVLKNNSLSVCSELWDKLKPWFSRVTSYQYYCEPHNKNTQGTQRGLEDLRFCYERIFSQKCGIKIGGVMSELIRRAFSDPYYLRFDYEADCSFHKEPSSKKRSKPHVRDSSDHYDVHQRESPPGGGGINHVGGGSRRHGGGGASPDLSTSKDLYLNKPHSKEYFDYNSNAMGFHVLSSYHVAVCASVFILQTVVRQMFMVMR